MPAVATTVTPTPKLSNSCYFHSSPRWDSSCRVHIFVPKASAGNSGKGNKGSKNKKTNTATPPDAITENNKLTIQPSQQQQQQQVSISLDDVNPVGLGRKSRQIFDEVWRKFSGLGQISRTTRADDMEALDALLIREGPMCEFTTPGAQNTTVLVVGATSRIGRIVVRKLMLRGYTVKVGFVIYLFKL